MKTISLKLTQVKNTKDGKVLVSIETDAIIFDGKKGAKEIAYSFCENIVLALNLARQRGATSIKVGTRSFSLNGKFNLGVNLNGQDFSTDDIFSFGLAGKTENTFKKIDDLFATIYQVYQTAEGKNPLLTKQADSLKKAIGTNDNLKLLA